MILMEIILLIIGTGFGILLMESCVSSSNYNRIEETQNKQLSTSDINWIIEQLERKLTKVKGKEHENTSDYFLGEADGLELAITTIKGCILANDMLYNDKNKGEKK